MSPVQKSKKRKKKKREELVGEHAGGECNVMGKRGARTEQAVGHQAPAAARARREAGTAAPVTPTHQPADSPAKEVVSSFFLFSFYLHIVCANASDAEVCCRHRGSVLDVQRSAG